jgi:hypothetical protein
VIRKAPSSQIPFFTDKPLAEFGFEAHQIQIIQTHPNSFKLPNLVIWMSKEPNIWLFGYLDDPKNQIQLFGFPKKTEETEFGDKSGSQRMCYMLL